MRRARDHQKSEIRVKLVSEATLLADVFVRGVRDEINSEDRRYLPMTPPPKTVLINPANRSRARQEPARASGRRHRRHLLSISDARSSITQP